MNKNDKILLFKSLCALLPYKPKVHIKELNWDDSVMAEYDDNLSCSYLEQFECGRIIIKPYLHPMESLNAKQMKKLNSLTVWGWYRGDNNSDTTDLVYSQEGIDWLIENGFDYFELLKKQLAIKK